ncbi:hypothetical protein ACOMHN_051976 [Nucella lapillus]
MGGRKNDVKRKAKPHKRRPLSAVIEEHEADDGVPKAPSHEPSVTNHSEEFPAELSASSCQNPCAENGNPCGGSVSASSSPPAVPGDSGVTNPPRNSLRSGRRQALTPSFSPPPLTKRGSSSSGSAQVLTSWFNVHNESPDSDDDTLDPSDMTRVRQTADRLHLSTRRPSVLQWQAQYVECPEFPLQGISKDGGVTGQNGDGEGLWTAERTERINTALDWIINELQEMRTQDQQLARQLLTIRSDLQELKLARSCEEHQDMLDDVQSELEDLQEFADVLDLPLPAMAHSPLRHLGVTRMNFSARRFSTC